MALSKDGKYWKIVKIKINRETKVSTVYIGSFNSKDDADYNSKNKPIIATGNTTSSISGEISGDTQTNESDRSVGSKIKLLSGKPKEIKTVILEGNLFPFGDNSSVDQIAITYENIKKSDNYFKNSTNI